MKIRTVDAFTFEPYAGNPAAVVLLEESFPADDRLQRLAAEMNLSETAYAHPLSGDTEADWALRWFTPRTEVDLCGHATLATAHVLRGVGAAGELLRFRTRSGVLTARPEANGEITLDFPTAPLAELPVPAGVAQALGAPVQAAFDTGPQVGDLMVEVADEQTVRGLAPDFSALARLPHRGVIVTAAAQDPAGGYDFVSRFFGPAVGIPEDPVTGSAHTALAPLWSERLGRPELTGLQASPRTGRVRTVVRGDRTLLSGGAVTVFEAELQAAL
ncbi:MAG TPA: PhzF family phenazine biosynthesis protein [Streptomyces sp.]|nr:PhzF family phenazine biosynthesis protein [Streptomyces sp.]